MLKARNAVRAAVSAVNAVVVDVQAACIAARAFIAQHGLPAFGVEEPGVAAALAWFDEAADVLQRVERRVAPVIALPATYPTDDAVWNSERLGALLRINSCISIFSFLHFWRARAAAQRGCLTAPLTR